MSSNLIHFFEVRDDGRSQYLDSNSTHLPREGNLVNIYEETDESDGWDKVNLKMEEESYKTTYKVVEVIFKAGAASAPNVYLKELDVEYPTREHPAGSGFDPRE